MSTAPPPDAPLDVGAIDNAKPDSAFTVRRGAGRGSGEGPSASAPDHRPAIR